MVDLSPSMKKYPHQWRWQIYLRLQRFISTDEDRISISTEEDSSLPMQDES